MSLLELYYRNMIYGDTFVVENGEVTAEYLSGEENEQEKARQDHES